MKAIAKVTIVIILLPLIFAACDNSVHLSADWTEQTIVYGLLNQDDSISYIKVTKAFLGEGNSVVMATVRDSSQYGVGDISVVLEKWLNNTRVKTFTFTETEIDDKEDGIFYNPYQTVYAAVTQGELNSTFNSDTLYTYKLIIKNVSDATITSELNLISSDFSVRKPIKPNDGRLPSISFVDNTISSAPVQWDTAAFAYLYNLDADFAFWEINKAGDTSERSVMWNDLKSITNVANELGVITTNIKSTSFYNMLFDKVLYADASKEDKIVKRRPGQLTLIFNMAAEDYYDYMNLSSSTGGFNQDVPTYSNIENGLGLFSARMKYRYPCQISEVTKNALYSNADYDALKFTNW